MYYRACSAVVHFVIRIPYSGETFEGENFCGSVRGTFRGMLKPIIGGYMTRRKFHGENFCGWVGGVKWSILVLHKLYGNTFIPWELHMYVHIPCALRSTRSNEIPSLPP